MNIWCWHGQTDSLPRLRRHPRGAATVEVTIQVGINVQPDPGQPTPPIKVTVEGSTAPGGNLQSFRNVREITSSFIQGLFDNANSMRGLPGALEPVRPYLEIRNQLNAGNNRYFEITIPGLPYGATFTYQIKYEVNGTTGYSHGPQPNGGQPQKYRLVLLDPDFTADDIRWVQAPDDARDEHWWTLSVKQDQGYDCLRLDMLTNVYYEDYPRLPCVKLGFPDGSAMDLGAIQTDPTPMPLINRSTDTILVCVPRRPNAPLDRLTITTGLDPGQARSNNVDLAANRSYWPTRLMLINYCIQGLNDLFAPPFDAYTPPRTYMQVTMRDEEAKYCSRPEQKDSGLPDGYALTLEAHRFYNVKSQWAFNAGVLSMIAHDTPVELLRLRDDVRNKLLIPCNAGFGAHRPPYYQSETNRRELDFGEQVIKNLLQYDGPGLKVYYPDQRLFKNGANELDAYRDAGVQYLVFDRSTVCSGPLNHSSAFFQGNNSRDGNYLWKLGGTDIGVLLIEDQFRDGIDGADLDERLRGKMARNLRRRFMQLITPKNPTTRRPLMVYGDDADKASGCGWFDGDFDGSKVHYNEEYQADLCWISGHPWVESVTTEDLNIVSDSAGDKAVTSATCPSVDPGGAVTIDQYGSALHFDQWHAAWQDFKANWLDKTLGQLSSELENALINWAGQKDELYQLAWMYFLMFTHESFWNKEPLEGEHTNDHRGVLEPEDFVLTESLEQRHAWVYLNANLWAAWAGGAQGGSGPFLDRGRMLDDVQVAGFAGLTGLFWDHDLLQNAVLYNDQVLVVMDRNGGCITNIFVRVNGQPLSVSGHCKSFQFLDTSHAQGSDPGTISDGEVFQNTVFTPNHAYVASDVVQASPFLGTYYDPRAAAGPQQQWNYPNNFNEYRYSAAADAAVFAYQPGTALPPAQLDRDSFKRTCEDDRGRRAAGRPGIVWHDPAEPEFKKTISLHGRTLRVSYEQVPHGHVVANEFCLDLYRAVLNADYQRKQVAANARSITLTGPRGTGVTLRLGNNCQFLRAALTPTFAAAQAAGNVSDYLDLHRVLTDDLQVECPSGGAFDYEMEFA